MILHQEMLYIVMQLSCLEIRYFHAKIGILLCHAIIVSIDSIASCEYLYVMHLSCVEIQECHANIIFMSCNFRVLKFDSVMRIFVCHAFIVCRMNPTDIEQLTNKVVVTKGSKQERSQLIM